MQNLHSLPSSYQFLFFQIMYFRIPTPKMFGFRVHWHNFKILLFPLYSHFSHLGFHKTSLITPLHIFSTLPLISFSGILSQKRGERKKKKSGPGKSHSTIALHLLSNRWTWLQQDTQSLLKCLSIRDSDHIHRRDISLVLKVFCVLIKLMATETYKYINIHWTLTLKIHAFHCIQTMLPLKNNN